MKIPYLPISITVGDTRLEDVMTLRQVADLMCKLYLDKVISDQQMSYLMPRIANAAFHLDGEEGIAKITDSINGFLREQQKRKVGRRSPLVDKK